MVPWLAALPSTSIMAYIYSRRSKSLSHRPKYQSMLNPKETGNIKEVSCTNLSFARGLSLQLSTKNLTQDAWPSAAAKWSAVLPS